MSVIELTTANTFAPSVDFSCPDTFCFPSKFRISLSEALLLTDHNESIKKQKSDIIISERIL